MVHQSHTGTPQGLPSAATKLPCPFDHRTRPCQHPPLSTSSTFSTQRTAMMSTLQCMSPSCSSSPAASAACAAWPWDCARAGARQRQAWQRRVGMRGLSKGLQAGLWAACPNSCHRPLPDLLPAVPPPQCGSACRAHLSFTQPRPLPAPLLLQQRVWPGRRGELEGERWALDVAHAPLPHQRYLHRLPPGRRPKPAQPYAYCNEPCVSLFEEVRRHDPLVCAVRRQALLRERPQVLQGARVGGWGRRGDARAVEATAMRPRGHAGARAASGERREMCMFQPRLVAARALWCIPR